MKRHAERIESKYFLYQLNIIVKREIRFYTAADKINLNLCTS